MDYMVLLLLLATLTGLQGTCPKNIVNNIEYYWDGHPPTNITEQLVGLITWLTAASFHQNSTISNIACAQTFVDENAITVTDVIYYQNNTEPFILSYVMKERQPGLIVQSDTNPENDDKLFIISLTENVFTYYQCQDKANKTYKGFSGVAVYNTNITQLYTSGAVHDELEEAYNVLCGLGIEPHAPLKTDCTD